MNSKTESDTKTSNMMDSQETLQTEENVTENVTPEVNETENQTIEVPQTQEEVVARVKELAEADAPVEKQELDALKQAFYKIHKANVAAAAIHRKRRRARSFPSGTECARGRIQGGHERHQAKKS